MIDSAINLFELCIDLRHETLLLHDVAVQPDEKPDNQTQKKSADADENANIVHVVKTSSGRRPCRQFNCGQVLRAATDLNLTSDSATGQDLDRVGLFDLLAWLQRAAAKLNGVRAAGVGSAVGAAVGIDTQ